MIFNFLLSIFLNLSYIVEFILYFKVDFQLIIVNLK